MICLDTNYLIMGLVSNSNEAGQLLDWAERGDNLCVSSIVWYEFLCGPITPQQHAAMRLLIHEVIPFDTMLATEAVRLSSAVGRSRLLRVDAMIAATATTRNIPLATRNMDDFRRFERFGLILYPATKSH